MSDALHEEVTQGDEPSAGTASDLVVNSPSADEMPPESEKGLDAGHGNRFQLKIFNVVLHPRNQRRIQILFGHGTS
jgi:hypothetical protein